MSVLFVLILVLSAALLAPGLVVGPSLDPAVFVQIAERLRAGDSLYLDAWDHKPPGIYVAYAAVQGALPFLDPWVAAWLLSVAGTVTAGLAVATALRHGGLPPRIAAAAAVGVVLLSAQYLTALGGGLTEPLANAPVAAALALVVSPQPGTRRFALAGVLLALAVLLSLQMLPAGLAVSAVALARAPGERRLPSLAALLMGGAAPLAGTLAWLALSGALPAATDALITYAAAYRASNARFGLDLSSPVISWTVLSSVFLLAPAGLGTLHALREAGLPRLLAAASIAWIGASCLLFIYQGRFFAHYAVVLAIPLAVLAAFGLAAAAEQWRRAPTRRVLIALPLIFGVAVSVLAGAAGARQELISVESNNTRQRAAVDLIRSETQPGDTILVWGNRPNVYLAARRLPAIPFSYFYPLATPGWATAALIERLAAEVAAAPPAMVVDAGSRDPGVPGFLPLLIDRPLAPEGRDVDLLDPLREFVRERYVLLEIADGWPIYVLRDPVE